MVIEKISNLSNLVQEVALKCGGGHIKKLNDIDLSCESIQPVVHDSLPYLKKLIKTEAETWKH